MQTSKTKTIAPSFLFGFLAAAFSLILSALITPSLLFLAIIEEISKLLGLKILNDFSALPKAGLLSTVYCLLSFASGFTIFELLLRKSSGLPITTQIIFPFLVHLTTTFILSLVFTNKWPKTKALRISSYLLLATLIHLCYNAAELAKLQ